MDSATDRLEIRYVRELPARSGVVAPWPDWLPADSPVRTAVEDLGIMGLWAHQALAADSLFCGGNVVLTTGTASGKSLAYLMPAAAAATDPAAPGHRGEPAVVDGQLVLARRRPATSLYLAPTKALAHDQARVCAELAVPGWRVATVDGDTDPADRQWAREHAHHVLTNPDLVHASLLPNHARWASFLRSLRYVVVDESHRYRGVFGAQVAAVLRRLRRVAAHYGAEPAFAVVSATTAEPAAAASSLTGLPVTDLMLVEDDCSPRGQVTISLARPEGSTPEDAAAAELAGRVAAGQQVLAFVPSRRGAEEVARSAAALARHAPSDPTPPRSAARGRGDAPGQGDMPGPEEAGGRGEAAGRAEAGQIVAYRAGYLAGDRRIIERGLAAGTIRGVAATNALELGVDIAGLDTVLLCGYPGSRAAFWQQAGRAGRRGTSAQVLLIARPNPLDAYLLDHPAALFDQPIEAPVLDPATPPVLGPQLAAAAQELPLRPGDERWFGPGTWPLVQRLTEHGVLRRRPDGWYWTAPRRAVDRINLRSTDSRNVEIIEEATGRVLGSVPVSAAEQTVHPGAVYVHQGETFLCDELFADPQDGDVLEAYVHAARPGYLTQPLTDVTVRPEPYELRRGLEGGALLGFGPVRVTSRVTGFLRRDELSGQVWDSTPLDCPARVLHTTGAVLTIPGSAETKGAESMGGRMRRDAGVHALEHLLTGLLPAVAANDRGDIGGHSWLTEDDRAVIAVFDQGPGSGFAARAYERADDWLIAARDRIDGCSCESGCPACILAPGCSSTRPLDKTLARQLLAILAPEPTRRG